MINRYKRKAFRGRQALVDVMDKGHRWMEFTRMTNKQRDDAMHGTQIIFETKDQISRNRHTLVSARLEISNVGTN